MTTATEFRQALLAIRDRPETNDAAWTVWVHLLKTQYKMPGHTITPAQLATAGRFKSAALASSNYRKLGHAIAEQLGIRPPDSPRGKREPMWWMAISSGIDEDDRAETAQFTMHPELVEALDLLRWVPAEQKA